RSNRPNSFLRANALADQPDCKKEPEVLAQDDRMAGRSPDGRRHFHEQRAPSFRRLLFDNTTIFQSDRAVRFKTKRRVMRRQKNRQALLGRESLKEGNERFAGSFVEIPRRFIRDQDLWFYDQCP